MVLSSFDTESSLTSEIPQWNSLHVSAFGEIRGLCSVFTEQLWWDINTSTFWYVSNKQNGLLSANMVLCESRLGSSDGERISILSSGLPGS